MCLESVVNIPNFKNTVTYDLVSLKIMNTTQFVHSLSKLLLCQNFPSTILETYKLSLENISK